MFAENTRDGERGYALSQEEKEESLEIVQKLKRAISDLSGDSAVAQLAGNEFAPIEGQKLSEQVAELFGRIGNHVIRDGFGDVQLTMRGIKSDIAHGIGRNKVITFAAVPQVIQSGRQIDYKQNWKGRNYDSYIFAAPVTVGTKTEYVAAVVIQDNESNRFYLHEAVDEDGNIVVIKNDNVPEAFKTRSDGRTRVTGASGTLSGTSITGNNSNVKEKFSMDEPVEETGTLIALHNMSSEKIDQTLELGAWPSPSIAIVQAEQGHTKYGAYSALFFAQKKEPLRYFSPLASYMPREVQPSSSMAAYHTKTITPISKVKIFKIFP